MHPVLLHRNGCLWRFSFKGKAVSTACGSIKGSLVGKDRRSICIYTRHICGCIIGNLYMRIWCLVYHILEGNYITSCSISIRADRCGMILIGIEGNGIIRASNQCLVVLSIYTGSCYNNVGILWNDIMVAAICRRHHIDICLAAIAETSILIHGNFPGKGFGFFLGRVMVSGICFMGVGLQNLGDAIRQARYALLSLTLFLIVGSAARWGNGYFIFNLCPIIL